MSRNGLSAGPLPVALRLPFASEVERASLVGPTFSPILAYAVKVNETNLSTNPEEIQIGADPHTLLMPDGTNAGVGIFQLTSFHPKGWRDPYICSVEAIKIWLFPAEQYWHGNYGLQGEALVRAVAAEFNAGRGNAEAGHRGGDVGRFTTYSHGLSYADRALNHYLNLEKGITP